MGSWTYAAGVTFDRLYYVVEQYTGGGTTGPITPMGNDRAELIRELEMMLADLKKQRCAAIEI